MNPLSNRYLTKKANKHNPAPMVCHEWKKNSEKFLWGVVSNFSGKKWVAQWQLSMVICSKQCFRAALPPTWWALDHPARYRHSPKLRHLS